MGQHKKQRARRFESRKIQTAVQIHIEAQYFEKLVDKGVIRIGKLHPNDERDLTNEEPN